MEVTAAEGAAPLIGEIEGHLAEDRRIVVVARLFGQPQLVRVAGDALRRVAGRGRYGAETLDAIFLMDLVFLVLGEQSDGVAEALVLRRRQPQLVAGLAVVVAAVNELG